jgi:AcrR family transcriptional regulator
MVCAVRGNFGPPPKHYFADFVEGRRGEILDAALAVFGEKGYEAGTMREIARRVGVTEPAIYRHYESKEAILSDIVATAGDRIAGQMRSGLEAIDGENVVPMLHQFIEMRRRGFSKSQQAASDGAEVTRGPVGLDGGAGQVMHVLFHAAPHSETFTAALREHFGQPLGRAVRDMIPRVDTSFGIKRSSAELDARVRVFISLFVGYFNTSMLYDAPPNDTAIVDAIMAIMGWTAPTA